MKESIEIHNFGGIKKLKLEIKPINILIGPQASGKSIVIKLIYYFKNLFEEIGDGLDYNFTAERVAKNQKERFADFFPQSTWPEGEFKIIYKYRKTVLSFNRKGEELQFDCESDNLHELISYISENMYHRKSMTLAIDDSWQIYIASCRNFHSTFNHEILLKSKIRFDPALLEFSRRYGLYKVLPVKKIDEHFVKLCSEVLQGTHLLEDDIDYLIQEDGRKIAIADASSSQQEALPLVTVLKSCFSTFFITMNVNLYIETPEALLFPTTQKKIVQLMARAYNSRKNDRQLFITTHSPYILSTFNNLLQAGIIAQNENVSKKELHKIVPEEEIIKPEDIIAYSLGGGKGERLYDEETGLIGENVIDEVSDELSIEFGKLLDLNFGDGD